MDDNAFLVASLVNVQIEMANAEFLQTKRSLADHHRRTKVLVVGPMTAVGGIGQVARMTVHNMDASHFDIATSDTTKDTPVDRSIFSALRSHARRLVDLVRSLRAHQPDVVHIHTCSYLTFYRTLVDVFVCRLLRYRYVLHIHGGLFDAFLASLSGVRKWWVSRSLRKAERVVVLGERWRTNLTRRVAGMKIAILPNAVDVLDSHASDEQVGRGGGVVFVGDLSESKRVEDLIVAYASLPSPMRKQFALHIVGGGTPQREAHLQALAHQFELADRVSFHGSLPHAAVDRMLRSADLFVLPSRAEGQPMALLEAMAAGVASVVTNVGAIPEAVTDAVEAALVNPCDPLQLAREIKALLAAPSVRAKMGRAARDRVEKDFSTQAFSRKLAGVWDEAACCVPDGENLPIPRLASTTFRSIL
ncbi:MAG: glycosyltransferase family 4 protein [Planctomycetes bacterium]|nr:glycosyltransferase family 4 protein [Planctomycetota bacterium]